jgi:glyoxylase-like metal-dependent hydrolase (beta-lactamase superfamily II)
MDGIRLADSDVVALDHVAPGLSGLRILFVNVFLISSGAESVLIDAGLYLSADRIRQFVERHLGEGRKPNAIVLTHAHFDHVGSLKDLADGWDVPVYVHQQELPYVTGKEKYPEPDWKVGGGIMAVLAPLYPRGPIDIGSRAQVLPADGSVPYAPGWRAIYTPGHTRGHVSFFRDEDRTLLVGDAFCTTKQESLLAIAQQRPELHGPPAYYTPDWDAAQRSVELLAGLNPQVIAPGHGQPIAGPHAALELSQLAMNFNRIARPEHDKRVA